MAVDPKARRALIRAFRRGRNLREAADEAGVAEDDASDILREEGFDTETSDWFFESSASFYQEAWDRSRRVATAIGEGALGRLPGGDRVRDRVTRVSAATEAWLVEWSARSPVKKSVAAMISASFFLAAHWLVDPEAQGAVALLFLGSFGIGAWLLYVHTRSPRLLGSSGAVVVATVAYVSTEGLGAFLGLSSFPLIVLEGSRATLIAFLGWAFIDAIQQATGFLEKLRVHLPLGSAVLTLGLFLSGTGAAFVELYLLTAYRVDPSTVRFVARYGVSYLLWALAGASLVFAHLYLLYLAALTSFGRMTTQRIAVATVTGAVLIGIVGANVGTILATQLGPPAGPMRIGIHANDVGPATAGPWDPFVHLEVVWANVETSPGVLDWSAYDAQIDRADAEGIEVYLLLGTAPPAWFAEAHGDAAMRDQAGRVFLWVDEDPRVEKTRVWDYSFASDAVVDAKENFTRAAAARYADRPSVVAVSIQNEPSWPTDFDVFRLASYDAYTVEAFRRHLEARFGTIESFNERFATAHGNWSEVDAPRAPEVPLGAEWLAFREELLAGFVDRLAAAVREETSKPVTVKILAHYLSRYVVIQSGLTERVLRAFVNASDVVSLDLYPLSRADLRRALVFFRGLAAAKPIWVAEFNFVLGSAIPGSGSAMYAALVEMSRFAERAIVFTWEGHYLYGTRLYPSVPGLVGIEMFRVVRDGGLPLVGTGQLLVTDLTAVPNLYGAYVLASEFANVPILPWPVLLLLLVPVPVADVERKVRIRRGMRLTAVGLFLGLLFVANLGIPM